MPAFSLDLFMVSRTPPRNIRMLRLRFSHVICQRTGRLTNVRRSVIALTDNAWVEPQFEGFDGGALGHGSPRTSVTESHKKQAVVLGHHLG
jgi:hypothetical protein